MDTYIWSSIFETEIDNKGILDVWRLFVDENFLAEKGWLQYSLCCFAKFCCSICGRKWASSKVHIVFCIRLQTRFGQVKMQIFKQKCKMCQDAEYEAPSFITENIEIVIKCLVNKISHTFYNLPKEDFPRNFVRDGRQDGPHDHNNCEACSMGICTYANSQDNKQKQQAFSNPEYTYSYHFERSHPYLSDVEEESNGSLSDRTNDEDIPPSKCCCIIL